MCCISARRGAVQDIDTVLQIATTGERSDGRVLQAAGRDSVRVWQE